ncbi:reverse transcriptase domain-containing protein [Tanacetum coccineum]
MNETQENYVTTEKELLAIVFAFDKFRQYMVLSKTIEFDIEIYDKRGAKNLAANHLSRLENPDLTRAEIRDLFPEERLMAISDKNNEPWNVVNFLKRLFERLGIPKALISDRRTHFCNYQIEKAMKRYGVVHRFSTAYYPQTNVQVENINSALKCILEKTIGNNKKDWSYKLDDALWVFRTTFKTPLETTPFRIIYGKACHLLVELEHKAYCAIKNCNMDLTKAGENRFLQINELDEMRLDAYELSIS